MVKVWSCLGLYTETLYLVEGNNLKKVKEKIMKEKGEPVSCQLCCIID